MKRRMTINGRREFLLAVSGFAASVCLAAPALAQASRTRIILLGTKGGPTLATKTGRSNSSTLLLINDVPYVIDCGYGVSRQLINAGVSLDRLRYIFITHDHSDHDLEYGALFYNSWTTKKPPRVDAYGPIGLQRMTHDFFNYMKFDIDTRIVDEGVADPRKQLIGSRVQPLRTGDAEPGREGYFAARAPSAHHAIVCLPL
jgi:ribonuclease BN (tRNA processing enzyme)